MSNENKDKEGYSIQDVSKKLNIPENTIRKYLTYFELSTDKVGRKTFLSEQTIQCLTEIVQLKSNGWSLKQIQTFRNSENNEQKNQQVSLPEESEENISVSVEKTDDSAAPTAEIKPDEIEKPIIEDEHKPLNIILNEYPTQITEEEQEPTISKSSEDDSFVEEPQNEPTEETTNEQFDQTVERPQLESKHNERHQKAFFEEDGNDLEAELLQEINQNKPVNNPQQENSRKEKPAFYTPRPRLTKDYINREIATQAKRASRLYRFLSSRSSARDSAEIKSDLDRRVEFLNGLRYIRDNWLDRQSSSNEGNHHHNQNNHLEKDLIGAN